MKYYTVKTFAEKVGFAKSTIRRMFNKGEIRGYKKSGKYGRRLFTDADVQYFKQNIIKKNETKKTKAKSAKTRATAHNKSYVVLNQDDPKVGLDYHKANPKGILGSH